MSFKVVILVFNELEAVEEFHSAIEAESYANGVNRGQCLCGGGVYAYTLLTVGEIDNEIVREMVKGKLK